MNVIHEIISLVPQAQHQTLQTLLAKFERQTRWQMHDEINQLASPVGDRAIKGDREASITFRAMRLMAEHLKPL